MKFGKQIREIVASSYPEWGPNFMQYKELKKRIAGVRCESSESTSVSDGGHIVAEDSPEEAATFDAHLPFFELLTQEVEKVNEFFLDKEEDCIIEHRNLANMVTEYATPGRATRAEVNALRERLIDLHAELVLLENFSTVNYTGFRKILKKHQKKTGLPLRSAYLVSVITTPFFLSNTTRRLVLSTEALVARLADIKKFRQCSNHSQAPPSIPPSTSVLQATSLRSPTALPSRPSATSVAPSRSHKRLKSSHGSPSPTSSLRKIDHAARALGMVIEKNGANVPPPRSLFDLVDTLSAADLSIPTKDTWCAGDRPAYYSVTCRRFHSVGVFVLPPGTKLQFFCAWNGAAAVTRLMSGEAELRTFRQVAKGSAKAEAVAVTSESEIVLIGMENSLTAGPLKSVASVPDGGCHEWHALSSALVLCVAWPPLDVNTMPQYVVKEVDPAAEMYVATREENAGQITSVNL